MAEEHKKSAAVQDLMFLLAAIIIGFVIWFYTGGPARFNNKPFIKPAEPIDSGETYGPSTPNTQFQ